MMRRTTFAGAFALALFAATAAEAAEPTPAPSDAIHRIAVVNDSDAPMIVYAEDAEGTLHEVATLKAGEVKLVDTEIGAADRAAFKLHARPTNSAKRYSTWGREGIVSDEFDLSSEETAIFWIAPDLGKSLVEIRGQ